MNKLILLLLLSILCMIACKEEAKPAVEEAAVLVQKTQAEISRKEGGHWEGREYIDGHFENVQSLRVPAEHTDHSWFIRYEGPGWESNKVGYRIYLDWRNAIDIFGKVTEELILDQVGQDGFDSYHEMQSWGTDILKVGKGLGIGSVGRHVGDEVIHFQQVDSTYVSVENDIKESSVNIDYYGWNAGSDKINLTSKLTIAPDQRITKHTIQASAAIPGICTGIVDHGVQYYEKLSNNGKWGYIATYGEQTLVPDDLGMAILYNTASATGLSKGEFDYLIDFKPSADPITYYLLGAWEQEKDGIKNETQFLSYLDQKLEELNNTNTL